MKAIPIHYSTNRMLPYGIDYADFASARQTQAAPSRLTLAGPDKVPRIKKCLLSVAIFCAFASSVLAHSMPSATPTATPLPVLYEQYGTAPTGVPLSWKSISPD